MLIGRSSCKVNDGLTRLLLEARNIYIVLRRPLAGWDSHIIISLFVRCSGAWQVWIALPPHKFPFNVSDLLPLSHDRVGSVLAAAAEMFHTVQLVSSAG